MDDTNQDMGSNEKENVAGQVLDSLGEPESAAEEVSEPVDQRSDDVDGVKKRLGRQARQHQKEIRALQSQLQEMQSRMGAPSQPSDQPLNYATNGYASDGEDERIRRAVSLALQHKDELDRRAKEQESRAKVQGHYQRLQDNLDNASDKYEDFDQVVRSSDAPFTDSIRDTALLIDNPEDVLYKLGKDRDLLKKISALHPIEQAKEVIGLSKALSSGDTGKSPLQSRPLGMSAVKASPVNSSAGITEKTPIRELRERMKSGWSWSGKTTR